ncbi:MAG TPA: rhodanese-like domain-containing protein, partial [Mycobacteriales bacterium]|nr:rhodanese-like domain-containing protein [Mycobacteriales bacterium]
LARAQWRSLQRLAELPDDVAVRRPHGDVVGQLGGLGTYPRYFRHLAEVNRRGPAPLPATTDLRPLSDVEVEVAAGRGAVVVDVRPVERYAAAHLPGSLSIPLRSAFATWLGWTTEPTTPLVVVRDDDQDGAEIVWQARKIGYDRLLGELAGGLAAWQQSGRATTSTVVVGARALDGRRVLDVRQRSEFTAGRVAGAGNAELGRLAEGDLPALPDGAAVMCGHGERAMTAASLLERAGRRDVAVVVGGPEDWARHTGRPLETGP